MIRRIIQIRKLHKLSQEKFAEKLGLSRNFINQVENGSKNVSDRTISDICREFNVREEWLRYGTEPIQKDDDATKKLLDDLISADNPFYDIIMGIIKTYVNLDTKSQAVIQSFSEELLKTITDKEATNRKKKSEELSDDERVELYRQELKLEREAKEKSGALRKNA